MHIKRQEMRGSNGEYPRILCVKMRAELRAQVKNVKRQQKNILMHIHLVRYALMFVVKNVGKICEVTKDENDKNSPCLSMLQCIQLMELIFTTGVYA